MVRRTDSDFPLCLQLLKRGFSLLPTKSKKNPQVRFLSLAGILEKPVIWNIKRFVLKMGVRICFLSFVKVYYVSNLLGQENRSG